MNNLIETTESRSAALESEDQIPSAFRRAFEPTPIETVATFLQSGLHSLHGWLQRQGEQVWLPRTIDPIAELKHVYLGEYGIIPSEFARSSPRRCCSDLPTWRS